jgi:hypothetical protein
MAGGFITMPQALSLLGNIPVLPAGAQTVIEGLRAARSMIPGDMGGLLGGLLNGGGIGSLLQNPIGSVMGQLQGQLGGMLGQLEGVLGEGAGGLSSILGGTNGLAGALGNLKGLTNGMSGLSGLAGLANGQFGIMDMVGHSGLADMLGSALPAHLSLDVVTQPLRMIGDLTAMAESLPSIAESVISGGMAIPDAIGAISSMTDHVNGVVNASTHAMSTLQGHALSISGAAAAVSMIGRGPPELQDVMTSIIRPSRRAEVLQTIADQVADVIDEAWDA